MAEPPNFVYERIQLTPNQLVYQVGDEFTFSLDSEPISGFTYQWFIYIQNNETGERRYYPDFAEGEVTDIFGNTDNFWLVGVPSAANLPMLGAGAWDGNSIAAPANGIAPGVVDRGMYTLGLELRHNDGGILYSRKTQFVLVDSVDQLTGNITQDTVLNNDTAYLLSGTVFVQEGATLTIEPGTVILGAFDPLGTLVVAQGGLIDAVGTAASPIIMTSDQAQEAQGRGQWGGLILNGRAPINIGVGEGEGGTGTYGGEDPEDNSGRLSYVRVEFAGREFSPDNELNGIAFQGVGSATQVDHLQVHYNQDDGVEFFGGTVNAKYLLMTSNRDDSVDWTEGWTGKLQYVVIQQQGDEADNGFEGDNKEANRDLLPRSSPTVYNATLIGDPDSLEGSESDHGMLIREGTAGTFRNFIVTGFKENGIDIDHPETVAQAQAGALTFANGIVLSPDPNVVPSAVNFDVDALPFTGDLIGDLIGSDADPVFIAPFDLKYPDFRPILFGTAYDAANIATPPSDGFFDTDVWFLGGVNPFDDFTLGWTNTKVFD
jgi:hypothetical protein